MLAKKFSTSEKLIPELFDYKVALDREAIQRAGLKICEVKQAIKECLVLIFGLQRYNFFVIYATFLFFIS